MKAVKIILWTIAVLAAAAAAVAQSTSAGTSSSQPTALPDAPMPSNAAPTKSQSKDSYYSRLGILCGAGASTSSANTSSLVGCGAGMTLLPFPVFIEAGVMGPMANGRAVSGYLSLDGNISLAPTGLKYAPMALVGYSRLFEAGNALDYGLALAMPRFGEEKNSENSLRLELRDYYTFSNPQQHNVMLRIGWMLDETD